MVSTSGATLSTLRGTEKVSLDISSASKETRRVQSERLNQAVSIQINKNRQLIKIERFKRG